MKRIKIMLVAITMVAAVGGTLAFKANSARGIRICTLLPDNSACPVVTGKTTLPNQGIFVATSTTAPGATACPTINCVNKSWFTTVE